MNIIYFVQCLIVFVYFVLNGFSRKADQPHPHYVLVSHHATHQLFFSMVAVFLILVQVGVLIGKSGDTIRFLQINSGAKIQITRDADADPYSATRHVELVGSLENITKAEKLIKDVIAEVPWLSFSFYFSIALPVCG